MLRTSLCLIFLLVLCVKAWSAGVPENVYKGDMVQYPGPWGFLIGKSAIVLVSDEQLVALTDPDRVVDLSLTGDKNETTLRKICENAQAAGHRTLIVAFDHFFAQYRPGQEGARQLTPDKDEYIEKIAIISKFAQQYGIGLELSLLSPLEIGPAYNEETGESGVWYHYRKGVRDVKTGAFDVQMWQQLRWTNNKGNFYPVPDGVRVFAFKERRINGTAYLVVDPDSIREISDVAKVEVWDGCRNGERARRMRIYGEGHTEIGDMDKLIVVQVYKTPEMDYFSESALPYLKGLIDKYADAGVKLGGLYSDEMHIQQDWSYHNHHENGEFAMRYASPGFVQRYVDLYGKEYGDFAKYMVYFTYAQEDSRNDVLCRANFMYVFGDSPEDIRRTALFRARYYRVLQDGVTDLFAEAKHYAEKKMGRKLDSRAHATWAESPTIDRWEIGVGNQNAQKYEYTSNFLWSNTVHQSAAACSDCFKWGDFLTGNGNDHAECGWLDRDYVGLVLACSTGIINEVPYSYAAHWGMPGEIAVRRQSLVNTYGANAELQYAIVEDMQHRDVDVLMLYPIDLVAVEERFGSWMTQYGYANMITQDKLLEMGRVRGGAIEIKGRRFTTLCTTFEPFPSEKLLSMMGKFVKSGGRLIWSGPPPVVDAEGDVILTDWQMMFGVDYRPGVLEGEMAPGRIVEFRGALLGVSPQTVLTDFLVDRVYPVKPNESVETAAVCGGWVVGTIKRYDGGGTAVFLGYRPRDDQSKSLGYETRNWFEVLSALGAYSPTGKFAGVNDNTEYVSRTTEYLACRFPNGTTAITRHLREVAEDWDGGFARDWKKDTEYLAKCPPPTEELHLRDFAVNGHSVTYDGSRAVAFRTDDKGELISFSGIGCSGITIDGKKTIFSENPLSMIAFAPIAKERKVKDGAVMQVFLSGSGEVRIPAPILDKDVQVFTEGKKPGSGGEPVTCTREGSYLVIGLTPEVSGRWLYVVPR